MAESKDYRRDIIKYAIRDNFTEITKNFQGNNVISSLYSKNVITDREKQHIGQESANKGAIASTEIMLDYICQKQTHELELFLQILKKKQKPLYKLLKQTIKKFEKGELSISGVWDIKDLTPHLRQAYLKPGSKWTRDEPIPGMEDDELIEMNIGDEHVMMTPVFKTQVLSVEEKKNLRLMPSVCIDDSYKAIDISKIEDLFGDEIARYRESLSAEMKQKVQENLILLTGIAGVGKSIISKKLLSDWAKETNKKFHAMFLIPMKDVQHKRIIDILSDNLKSESGDSLLNQKEEALQSHLQNSELAKQFAFIIDGADERDLPEEIENLIKGELYKGCTVLMTSRPEGKCFDSLRQLKPLVRVELQGTDEESVHRFLSVAINNAEEKDSSEFLKKYREHLVDLTLLHIPLYLTLIGIVFNQRLANGFSLTDFAIPKTMTMLFNCFFNVLIRRWARRLHEKENIDFKRSPLDNTSTVPKVIQRILYFIGNMCYKGLCENCYEFNENEVQTHLLTNEELTHSGLFCVNKYGKNKVFFLMHKQLQEYLASLYLTYEGMDTPPCTKIFTQCSQEPTLVKVIMDHNMFKTFQFCCGMSPKFLQFIFRDAIYNLKLVRNENMIDIYYEASLVYESTSEFSDFEKYLKNAKWIKSRTSFAEKFAHISSTSQHPNPTIQYGIMTYYEKCLTFAMDHFDTTLKHCFLEKMLHLRVTKSQPHDNLTDIKVPQRDVVQDKLELYLDQFTMELLDGFVFQNIKEITVRNGVKAYLDLPGLFTVFPNLESLDAGAKLLELYEHSETKTFPETSCLKAINLLSLSSNKSLPGKCAEYLCNLDKLESVILYGIDILSQLRLVRLKPQWSNLKKLILVLVSDLENECITALGSLLEGSPLVERLTLVFDISSNVDNVKPLTASLSKLTHIQRLSLQVQPLHFVHEILECLEPLPHLNCLSTELEVLIIPEEEVVSLICKHRNLHKLEVIDWDEQEGQVTSPQYVALETHGVNVQIIRHEIPKTLNDQIECFKEW